MASLLTYAIGDIHGSYTKLVNLLRHVTRHCDSNDFRIVFLGDYVDRGRRSREAVNLLIETQTALPQQVVCLKGNHEEMVVDAANGRDEMVWLDNGGDATLKSYGVRRAADIPVEHLAWFEQLPLAITDEKRLFVHAGIMPGIPLRLQRKEVMLWIREPFLSDESDHGQFIVHGHTPCQTLKPDLRPNRLNVDTYAFGGGPLTAAVFDERMTGPLAFIADDGTVTPAPPIAADEHLERPARSRAQWR
jgi:serine/threonine protein phosphatase 1